MYHIIIIALLFAPPKMHFLVSRAAFADKAACEVQRPIDAAKWEAILADTRHTIDAQCMTLPEAEKLAHDLGYKIPGAKENDDSI